MSNEHDTATRAAAPSEPSAQREQAGPGVSAALAKRALDVAVAASLLATLSPALGVMAAAVKATSPGPVLFRQTRVGRGGRPFTIYKFRTMAHAPGLSGPGAHLQDEQRVTKVGRLLRKASLDELPQLWNVLAGDMSLVGPRPDLPHHAERYSPAQRRRLEVRPGITGWAQVNGRNQITWAERMELDVEYVRRRSFLLDLGILARTARVVLGGRGADATVRGGARKAG